MHLTSTFLAAALGAVGATALWAPLTGWLVWQLRLATRRAGRDPLTGLAHRDTARAAYRQRLVAGQLSTVLVIDLDRFKPINDNLGHHAGDQIVSHTAAHLARLAAQWHGVAARLGGDEFAVLLPADDAVHIQQVQHLRAAIAEPVTVDGHHGPVTLSVSATVGIVVGDEALARVGWEAMLRAGDLALYHAKRGQLAFQIHHPGLVVPPRFDDLRLRDLPGAQDEGDR